MFILAQFISEPNVQHMLILEFEQEPVIPGELFCLLGLDGSSLDLMGADPRMQYCLNNILTFLRPDPTSVDRYGKFTRHHLFFKYII
jgi:hypothetical protein